MVTVVTGVTIVTTVTMCYYFKIIKMNLKEQAYQLHKTGLSFKEVGDKMGISKTTAYEYVKELKLIQKKTIEKPVPNSSELGFNVRSEQTIVVKPIEKTVVESTPIVPITIPKIKEFTGNELIKKQFVSLPFEGKFLELIGKPSKLFSGIIWGLPKGGKSNFALRFADYLQEYFGKVVYVAAEEGESVTLQDKFKEIGGSMMTIVETRNRDTIRNYLIEKDYDFVFIDSINNAGIDSEFLEILKTENPNKSFISIVQATKGGNFKGDQALTHNCDFIIKIVAGVAYHTGRFGIASEIKIFEEALYQKNKAKVEVKVEEENNLGEVVIPETTEQKPSAYDLAIAKFKKNREDAQKEKAFLKPFSMDLLIKKPDLINTIKPVVKKSTTIKSQPSKISPSEAKALLLLTGGYILANFLFGNGKSKK
jgi:hypothetical protein